MLKKVAILGGGVTGLTAAYYLAKKGYKVTLFEKEVILGGQAAGFKSGNWDWYLERTYHHLFSNDFDILNFAKEIGFAKIFFKSPETASLYKISNFKFLISKQIQNLNNQNSKQNRLEHLNFEHSDLFRISDLGFRIYPFDTPTDFLRFPLLSFPQKLRAGLILAFLKFSPFFSLYERMTAEEFLRKTMGSEAWNVLWKELFRKKFGKYAGNILASFFWARIKKRTKDLGYIEGGFQALVDYLTKINRKLGVVIKMGHSIKRMRQKGRGLIVDGEDFDAVISTLPTPILVKIGEEIFPEDYLKKLAKIKYLHGVNLILETKQPLLKKAYWVNISVKELPFMVLVQHTNFIEKKYYDDHHLLYVGWYVDNEDRLLKMDKDEILNFIVPYLRMINPNFQFSIFNFQSITNNQYSITNSYLFRSPFAQPIFDREFLKYKPDFETPVKNFYIANLDMTYPYDRGTNYAVKLGKEIASILV